MTSWPEVSRLTRLQMAMLLGREKADTKKRGAVTECDHPSNNAAQFLAATAARFSLIGCRARLLLGLACILLALILLLVRHGSLLAIMVQK